MTELRDRLLEAFRLKHVARAGWLRLGVDAPESVAGHSWGVCYLVLTLCPPDVDRGRALAIATLHDVAEARVGDITPHDGVTKSDKRVREQVALEELLRPVAHPDELMQLWLEYEHGTTPEGRFVKACDKLDMALQAAGYASSAVDVSEIINAALQALEGHDLLRLAQ